MGIQLFPDHKKHPVGYFCHGAHPESGRKHKDNTHGKGNTDNPYQSVPVFSGNIYINGMFHKQWLNHGNRQGYTHCQKYHQYLLFIAHHIAEQPEDYFHLH